MSENLIKNEGKILDCVLNFFKRFSRYVAEFSSMEAVTAETCSLIEGLVSRVSQDQGRTLEKKKAFDLRGKITKRRLADNKKGANLHFLWKI